MRSIFFLAALICAASAAAGEPSLTAPEEIPVGTYELMPIVGIDVGALKTGFVNVYPKGKRVQVLMLQQLGGTPVILFRSQDPGTFWILVVTAKADQIVKVETEIKVVGKTDPVDPDEPDDPIDPDDPVTPWNPSGLHVVVIDDENERGKLPQSQVNIFTSQPLAEYLNANCAKINGQPAYRFSSNDSLASGQEARKLESPVIVQGWDAVMKAVSDGKVRLPAWAVSNGRRGVIESLPTSVDACLSRLKEFK